MKPRVLLVIVVLLVLCCVCGGGLSAGGGGLPAWMLPDLDAETLGEVGSRFTLPLKTEDLTDDDPRDDCYLSDDVFVVPAGESCAFIIAASTSTTRRLKLLLTQGETIVVELEQEDALIVEATLAPGQAVTPTPLDVYRNLDEEDATLTIRECEPGGEGDDAPTYCLVEVR